MKTLQIFFLLFFPCWLLGQNYLNKTTLDAGGTSSADLLVTDTTYLIASQSIFDWRQMDFGLFDLQGNLLKKKSYLYDSIATISNCGKCLTEINNYYYFGQTHFETGDSAYVVFHVLNSNLDTLFSKKHLEFEGNIPQIFAMEFDTDSSFIATGYVYRKLPTVFKYDLWVAKFDTAFNVIWEKRFEDNYPNLLKGYVGTDIELDSYGSVIVSGEGLSFNGGMLPVYIRRGFAARLNTQTGKLYWLKEFSGPEGSQTMFTLDQGDGTYRFVESQIDKRPLANIQVDYTTLRLGILDTTGTVLWDTLGGPEHGYFFIQDFYLTLDGNYYVSGKMNYPPFFHKSAGYKFSPKGDSLWYREYFYQDTLDISQIYSFQPTADSGYIHLGRWADYHNTQTNFVHTWFLKTDKFGCHIPGCHTLEIEEFEQNGLLHVFPNPSDGNFVLKYEGPDLTGHLHYKIFDAMGKIIMNGTAVSGISEEINLKNRAAGLYIIKIYKGNKEAGTQKLLVK